MSGWSVLNQPLQAVYKHAFVPLVACWAGVHVKNTYIGCPTCVGDVLLLSSFTEEELQMMMNMSVGYAVDHDYIVHDGQLRSQA